ncbi:AvaI/BsoBI family type II restriction endonuclease [Trichothermofontia sichuanensis]|uniref:AvaI/BsoBI family type II restriction endonuclease n=1 Tax=Trichothermofontia sichuanensis TaxID=3045816 RepID=UPI0036F2BDAF
MGELKGGIDPAGADEHWKTAQAALNRIRQAFADAGHVPLTFFVGAAIEKRMAREIWEQLESGMLNNAANLNEENQVASISRWLCSL